MEWTYDKLKIVPVADFKFQNLIVVEIKEDRQVLNGTATIQVCNIGLCMFMRSFTITKGLNLD